SWGAWGVLGSISLMAVHSFLPFPAEVIALANGMVYGPLWGTIITWVGAMIGASLAFWVVRLFGRPFIQRFVSTRHQQALEQWSHNNGTAALLVSRLIPVIAFNLINYAAALTEVSWWTFLWTTGLGILPLTVLLATAGDHVMQLPLWVSLVISLCLLASWFIVVRWRRGRSNGNSH
ncbi:MAG: TVP38/TMEM64 family protein, partial [Herbaspirillum sp.]